MAGSRIARAEDALIARWKPVFEAEGIDPRRVPLDNTFHATAERVEFTYLLDVNEKGWPLINGKRETRTLVLR